MGLIKPKKLKQGDTIGIFGSSTLVDPAQIENSATQLRQAGFNVEIHPQTYAVDRGSAGTTEEKVAAFHDLVSDPSVHAILSGRGGARALHMLDKLDYGLIARHPKIIMGFSDVTTLLSAIHVKTGLVTFHTITAGGYHTERPQISPQKTLPFLQGNWSALAWPTDYPTETIRQGNAEGILYGGNLHLLMALITAGPSYIPDWTGKLLVVADVGEEIRSVDRMFGAMRLRGIFDQIAGLIVGQMTDITDTSTSGTLFNRTIREVVMEHTAQMKGPVVLNAPIGHEHPNIPFPIGIKARLTAPSNGKPQIQLLESPFADA